MKILVISDLYPPFYKGGHEIRCKIIADCFLESGHEVDVLTCFYGPVEGDDPRIHRKLLPLAPLKTKNVSSQRQIINYFKCGIFGIANYFISLFFVLKVKPDIVYAGQISGISAYPIRAFTSLKIPVVHHVGNYFLVEIINRCIHESKKFKRLLRRIFHGFSGLDKSDFSHIIAVSEFVRKEYIKAGVPEECIVVIPPRGVSSIDIVDAESFKFKSSITFRLLYVGRVVERKGLRIAVEALNYLVNVRNRRDFQLVVIGDGDEDYMAELIAMISSFGIEAYIQFKGKMLHEDVAKEYELHQALVVPSIWEDPNPSVVIEAMARGIVVVGSRVGGIPDRVEDGKSGILVPPGDPVRLGEALLDLADNPDKRRQICIEGLRKARNDFSNEKIVQKLLDYMESIQMPLPAGRAGVKFSGDRI